MVKRFSKRITRKKTYKLSPKNAEEIIRQEFTDSRGNKVINILRFKPQSPFEPDFKQTVTTKYIPEEEK